MTSAYFLAETHTRTHTRTHTHTHTFNGPLSRTTHRHQKGETNLDFTENKKQYWHQLGHMQVCISLQTGNHTSTRSLSFYTGRMPFQPPNQQQGGTNI